MQYSDLLNKLYIRTETTYTVQFKCHRSPPPGYAPWLSPALPSLKEDRFIRCEHTRAKYETDSSTGRKTVLLPYESPPANSEWVTASVQFVDPDVDGTTVQPDRIVLGRRGIDFPMSNENQSVPPPKPNKKSKPLRNVLRLTQWFLTLLEVLNPASFISAFTGTPPPPLPQWSYLYLLYSL